MSEAGKPSIGTIAKQRLLIEALLDKTKKRNIAWNMTNNHILNLSLANRTIILRKNENSDYENLYVCMIYNDREQLVEDFSDEHIADLSNDAEPGKWYKMMEMLFDTGQRQATGADVAIDEILEALDDTEVPF